MGRMAVADTRDRPKGAEDMKPISLGLDFGPSGVEMEAAGLGDILPDRLKHGHLGGIGEYQGKLHESCRWPLTNPQEVNCEEERILANH